MNFYCCSAQDNKNFSDLEAHLLPNKWTLYLDKGWTRVDNYFYKGFSTSWCKIYIDPTVRIETNKLRDFPIYYNQSVVCNFQPLENVVPVDGIVELDEKVNITYQKNFYPRITHELQTFKECHEILYDAVIENVGTFASANKKPVLMPEQGGIDTLTVRSVFDFLHVPYKTFNMPEHSPPLSAIGEIISKSHWGFKQVQESDQSVIATGFYGDEWILRNPYYVHSILSNRDIDICEEFDKLENCYMKQYFENYRSKCQTPSGKTLDELVTEICNDFQIWHLNETSFLSPLKHITLLTLLSADTETILGQVTNAELSKSIIEKCNPSLLDQIDLVKNIKDPTYF